MSDDAGGLAGLLEFLRRQRGFDFSGYKRASLERRLRKRMEEVEVESYGAYVDYLQVHPEEFALLFDTVLINVTSFFRDAAAWTYLREQVLPDVVGARPDGELRVWSAGCASGEEAYSMAMCLVAELGEDAFRERVKLYGTDVDEAALEHARHGLYPAQALEDVLPELVERCFEPADGRLAFRKDLRRNVIFGRNDLTQDTPISRIDVLLCRNTLMYFTAESQARILARFNFALQNTGVLFLGKSEMLLTHGHLFSPVDLKCRIFKKVPRETLRDRLAFVPANGKMDVEATDAPSPLREGAFDAASMAQMVISEDGVLMQANRRARALFGITAGDRGRPLEDLEVSHRPLELRSVIEKAVLERRPVSVPSVVFHPSSGEDQRLDVQVAPLVDPQGLLLGTSITFIDVTAYAELADELDRSKRDLGVAYEELQSTVEELETTNEELQSTNEELETINDELRERTAELDDVNASFEAILTSLRVAAVVVDRHSVVRIWNAQAGDMFGVRADDAVGKHLDGIDIGLPVDQLRAPLQAAVAGERPDPLALEATNRRGRRFQCRVSALPLYGEGDGDGEVRGAIVLMEPSS